METAFRFRQRRSALKDFDDPTRGDHPFATRFMMADSLADTVDELAVAALGDVLFRSTATLHAEVDRFLDEHGLRKSGFVAMHMRWLEGGCPRLINQNECAFAPVVDCIRDQNTVRTFRGRALVAPGGGERLDFLGAGGFPTEQDICYMTDCYIEYHNPAGLPIFLLHDRQRQERADEIIRTFNATLYAGKEDGARMDMLIALESSFFVGNVVSTFSSNIALARAAVGRPIGPVS